ncbi:MAG: selenium-dependent xanthine dehydrogenase [Armatimonadota bacterium]|nr:selenium-dependent xanthine dehydrogenase [Armatimonadota bacterium]MDR7460446.1 selenium-dependent xanthine dehydrogenase [Armatimonadota bacterium]MDR7478260.1 selenium-dependent xanthine dehydrogenase [Armatimonadota bacterium]MDR7491575.1 selenium-dependent xanthine dehydrogenase [Armatimonadota bacterium]MDR7501153.1 selenium-dependent xanthine dehydrogenase [Armatimonadota bacterium]
MAIAFTLNGRPVTVEAPPGASLLEVLREQCGLTSMKDGCAPEGSCGACTVMVDGRAVVSCAQPAARVAGRQVTTLEGLPPKRRALWADCFVAAGASQCGFCSPGIVMKAEALLARQPTPSRAEIARALAGNLCRCTGYVKIVDAIEHVAAAGRGVPPPAVDWSGRVGSRTGRYEGRELALGTKPYVNDLRVPGLLHGALRFSDHPRARVVRIDTTKARAYPGVVAVATWRDVPGERTQGLITRDWRQFVAEGETTAYVGDVLAAVAATSRAAAREAAALIEVEYEVLEPVTDPVQALQPDAPRLHERGNVLSVSTVKRGDVDAALASAAHVLTETFQTQFIEHAFLEPESALVVPEADGTLHVYSQGQGPWDDRRQVASFLGWPEDRVRVTQVSNGGAFGAKEDLNVQCHAALLAVLTGRPVLVTLSRRESIRFHTKRHPLTMTYTVGCDAEGHLVAVRARIVGDTGAYASVGDKVLERAAGHACGPYRVPAVDVEATAVYTNNPPAGAMRGFGVPQVAFAMEGMLDRLAERVGIDPWEIRWRNALETGDIFATGQRLGPGVGLKRTLLAVRDIYRSARYAGIACGVKNTGVGNGLAEYGKAILRPEADGTVILFHSWTEMGQGVHTALQQIACEELGLTADRVRVVVDTIRELNTGQCTASRSTVLGGRAVIEAARRLRAALDGRRLEELAGQEFYGEFVVDWTTKLGVPNPVTHFAYGWATQVVILDDQGRVAKVVCAHDVGKVINPTLLEGQIEGSVHMGLGYALSEEFVVEGGVPVTDTLKSLGIWPATAMPEVECIFVEEPQPEGPYGAKGVGEIGMVPTAAAVAGALHAYDGIRRTRLPMRDAPASRVAAPKRSAVGRAVAAAGASSPVTAAGGSSPMAAAGGPSPGVSPPQAAAGTVPP